MIWNHPAHGGPVVFGHSRSRRRRYTNDGFFSQRGAAHVSCSTTQRFSRQRKVARQTPIERTCGSPFNSSEKRLARILLLLAHSGKAGTPEAVVPKIDQEMLAEMIGQTARSST